MLLASASCKPKSDPAGPAIQFTRIPQADAGGREKNDIIEGSVRGARAGQQLVLYARGEKWWVQPLVGQPFTRIQASGKFSNATHLGTEYAALLVDAGYRPPAFFTELPERGSGVASIQVTRGANMPPSKTVRFSGYEWRLRDAPSNRGGNNQYDPANIRVDENGAMHLSIAQTPSGFTCSEVSLTRSLGYGTYRFVVRDISQLEPAAVFGMFTWDYAGGEQGNREVDIEISQWGDSGSKNAQYVVQPYYVAANVARFQAPSGRLTHVIRWELGRMEFRTLRANGAKVAEHVFTSGVPSPGIESVRMNLYQFRAAARPLREASEVVIERFEYLP